MKEIIIRTNFDQKVGLGHIIRCKILKKEFQKKNLKTTFIIDNNIKSEITKNLNIINLGKKKFNPTSDAYQVFNIIKDKKILFLLVDDYRIDYKWENFFLKRGYKLVVLDDLANRKHVCNHFIDSGWHGKENNSIRYNKLLNKKTKKYFGPKFKILDSKIKLKKTRDFNILISFGGGNYITFYYNLINKIIKKLTSLKKRIIINIIYSGFFKIKSFQNKKNIEVKIIKGNFDLASLINKTSLYIGANGSIVNELSYLKIPRVLIAVNKLQNVDINTFQELGNYICINYPNKKYLSKISELTFQIVKDYKRAKKLFDSPKIRIDKSGAKRISKILLK